jgi:hypothetical protein
VTAGQLRALVSGIFPRPANLIGKKISWESLDKSPSLGVGNIDAEVAFGLKIFSRTG